MRHYSEVLILDANVEGYDGVAVIHEICDEEIAKFRVDRGLHLNDLMEAVDNHECGT